MNLNQGLHTTIENNNAIYKWKQCFCALSLCNNTSPYLWISDFSALWVKFSSIRLSRTPPFVQ